MKKLHGRIFFEYSIHTSAPIPCTLDGGCGHLILFVQHPKTGRKMPLHYDSSVRIGPRHISHAEPHFPYCRKHSAYKGEWHGIDEVEQQREPERQSSKRAKEEQGSLFPAEDGRRRNIGG